ncbi:IPT/TIG domain-containing protein [Actinoplanes sp. GCM10030250]|uniref:IPT/TIG domain-containing protein n=1 Tax=Actinoplanes sp. GCM10030250 TaxID=3273376 RepID=UPI003616806F
MRKRKSQERIGMPAVRAGVAVAVTTAAVVAATALPAFATTVTVTFTPTQAPTAAGTTITVTGTNAFTNANTEVYSGRFVPSTVTCSGAIPAVSATAVDAGTVTRVDNDSATLVTPALTAGSWKLCFWDDYASTLGSPAATSSTVLTAVPYGSLNSNNGQVAEKITLTNSGAPFTAATYSTQFVSGVTACPATYTAAGNNNIVATTAKTSTSVLTVTVPAVTAGTPYLICSYAGTTNTSALLARSAATFATFDKTLPAISINPTGGSSGVETTVTVATPGTSVVFAGSAPAALVTRGACPNTYPVSLSGEPYAAAVTKISGTKIAATMPQTVVVGTGDVTTNWNLCAYASSSAGATMITAPAIYSVAPVLDLSTAKFAVGSASAATSGSGPAQGGSTITISDVTGIPMTAGATLSASLGGSPINNIKAISSTEFTGTTSAHSPGPVNLSVTTAAGTKSTTNTPYTYSYGITVTPNVAATDTTPVLDITGAGFGSLVFGTVSGSALAANRAYVLLTDNTWNAQTFSTDTDALVVKAVTYCNTVLPISDTEIICTLDLTASISAVSGNAPTIAAGTEVPAGTYTVTVVNSGEDLNTLDYDYSIVSSGSSFTVAPF